MKPDPDLIALVSEFRRNAEANGREAEESDRLGMKGTARFSRGCSIVYRHCADSIEALYAKEAVEQMLRESVA